jgi:Coatomer WD associated region
MTLARNLYAVIVTLCCCLRNCAQHCFIFVLLRFNSLKTETQVQTGQWVGACFLYTNEAGRLNYYVGGEVMTLCHLDHPMYMLGYLPKEDRVYLMDKSQSIHRYYYCYHCCNYKCSTYCYYYCCNHKCSTYCYCYTAVNRSVVQRTSMTSCAVVQASMT